MAWLADDSRFASLDNLNAFYSAKLRCSSLNYVRTASVASPPACRVVSTATGKVTVMPDE
jgi:hypothetical protein